MTQDSNDAIRRAEEVEDDVAPRSDPGTSGGGDPDDGIPPDDVSAND